MNAPENLPEPRQRHARGGPPVCRISTRIEMTTPMLGGGSQTRMLDEVEAIRAATVRGHLRFWWRALYASRHQKLRDSFECESGFFAFSDWDTAVAAPEPPSRAVPPTAICYFERSDARAFRVADAPSPWLAVLAARRNQGFGRAVPASQRWRWSM